MLLRYICELGINYNMGAEGLLVAFFPVFEHALSGFVVAAAQWREPGYAPAGACRPDTAIAGMVIGTV